MTATTTFTKKLAAASSNNIAASQSGSAGVALVLNGSTSNYLSTTTSAATAAGGTVLTLSSVSGVVVGQGVSDTTNNSIPTGAYVIGVNSTSNKVVLSQPVGGASGVANGDTIVFAGTATIDTATSTNIAIGRRVVIAYTGTDTSFTIVGTNAGASITDTAVGGSGTAQSNLDFVTVTSITPVGGGLTGVTAGTNGVGSSPWWTADWLSETPMNLSMAVEIVSGSANFTVQYTYDDPNNLLTGLAFPVTFASGISSATSTVDASLAVPVKALRLLINSGTGELRTRFTQAGVG